MLRLYFRYIYYLYARISLVNWLCTVFDKELTMKLQVRNSGNKMKQEAKSSIKKLAQGHSNMLR